MHTTLSELVEQHRRNWSGAFDPLLTPFSFTLHRSQGNLLHRASRVMAQFDLSPAEFDVLASLRRSPAPHELTPSQLQLALLITSGGLTKILQQLERRGLIVRSTAVGDRRVKPVRLTEAAYGVIDQAMRAIIEQVGGWITATLSDDEIREVTRILGRMTAPPP